MVCEIFRLWNFWSLVSWRVGDVIYWYFSLIDYNCSSIYEKTVIYTSPERLRLVKGLNQAPKILSIERIHEIMNFILGIKYPFYATQWHPEKNIFEWTRQEDISHSPNAIAITQYLSNFFVDEARKNHLKFPSEMEELANLIFRFSPVYSGGHSLFEQVYVFGNNTEKLVEWLFSITVHSGYYQIFAILFVFESVKSVQLRKNYWQENLR